MHCKKICGKKQSNCLYSNHQRCTAALTEYRPPYRYSELLVFLPVTSNDAIQGWHTSLLDLPASFGAGLFLPDMHRTHSSYAKFRIQKYTNDSQMVNRRQGSPNPCPGLAPPIITAVHFSQSDCPASLEAEPPC